MGRENIIGSFKGVIDSTLREGMQFHSANFNLEQQRRIIESLNNIGVDMMEVSNPFGDEVRQNLKVLTAINPRPNFLAHIRNKIGDVEASLGLVDGVNILCIADEERLSGMGLTIEEHLSHLQQCVLLAKQKKLETRVGVEHYFTGNKERALSIIKLADQLGVDRISIPDTLGIAMGWDVAKEIAYIRQQVKADIEVHFHNDLGQATANAFTAVKSGGNYVDTTLLGIGDRTGITPLSTFLAGLHVINPSLVSNYRLEYLTQTDHMVANMLGIKVPFNMVTNQENGFAHKAGTHLNTLIKHGPKKYEGFSPGVIGNDRRLIIGSPISGRTTETDANNFFETYGTK